MRKPDSLAGNVALAALLTAVSLIVLYGACLAPSGKLGVTAAAGLLPTAGVISGGLKVGLLCYGGTAVLALLLLPDKGIALLFGLFFGLYPLLKAVIERLRRLAVELILKLAVFNVAFALFWMAFRSVFFSVLALPEVSLWLICLAGNIVFLAYDFGMSKLIAFYIARIDRPMRKGRGS